MARTTLAIDDDLLRRIKRRALEEKKPMQDITNALLRHALRAVEKHDYRLKLGGWDADLQPGVDITDRDKLFNLLDGR